MVETPIEDWTGFFYLFFLVDPQGGLDMKYLEDRYTRGKAKCASILESQHTFASFDGINLAHGEIVQKQAELGCSTQFLTSMSVCIWFLGLCLISCVWPVH